MRTRLVPVLIAFMVTAAAVPLRAEAEIAETPPAGHTEAERQLLAVIDDVDKTQRAGSMAVPPNDGRLLRILAESVGAKHVVELGTSYGYSGLWWCLALRTTGGRLTTYEIDPKRAARARENFKRGGVESLVTIVEGDAHAEVTKQKEPIDILFLDADKSGYLDYLRQLLPLVRPGGLVVAHNMTPDMADPAYVKAITTDPALETLFVDLGRGAMGLTLKKRALPAP